MPKSLFENGDINKQLPAKLVKPLKWHGGKHYLASWIIEQMPPHLHYVEPYFGGGSVLLARDPDHNWMGNEPLPAHQRGCSEVVNDLNGDLVNFWMVLRDEDLFQQFMRRAEATPVSQRHWEEAAAAGDAPIERAVNFFIRARQSRQGLGSSFATLSRTRTRRGMQEQVSSWLSALEGLPDVHQRLRRVVILSDDARDVIRKQDGDKTHVYCDPPYLGPERTSGGEYGQFEMTEQQHEELLQTLADIRGTFQLSGYHSKLYDDFGARQGWRCAELAIDNKASAAANKQIKTECLWMNY
ncbi:MAG: DNA adenine methylase [Pirellulaceae bacterium]